METPQPAWTLQLISQQASGFVLFLSPLSEGGGLGRWRAEEAEIRRSGRSWRRSNWECGGGRAGGAGVRFTHPSPSLHPSPSEETVGIIFSAWGRRFPCAVKVFLKHCLFSVLQVSPCRICWLTGWLICCLICCYRTVSTQSQRQGGRASDMRFKWFITNLQCDKISVIHFLFQLIITELPVALVVQLQYVLQYSNIFQFKYYLYSTISYKSHLIQSTWMMYCTAIQKEKKKSLVWNLCFISPQ